MAALILNVGWDQMGAQFAVTRGVAAKGARGSHFITVLVIQ